MLICFAFISCSEKDDPFTTRTIDVQGKVEKGPFISGSTISIQPMDTKLQVLGNMYTTTISDDIGNFVLGSKEFTTPYVEIMANGYFFNEVSGQLSNGTLTLKALADLTNSATVYVNILTHLKYARVKHLVLSGKEFSQANTQAQKELFNAFGLNDYANKDVSLFSIAAGTDESAALIAISSLLLMDRSEAAFTEYLSKISGDFGKYGIFSDVIKKQMEEDKQRLAKKLPGISQNIVDRYNELGIAVKVKDLKYYIDWNNDGEAGNEILKIDESVILDKTSIEVPNEGGTFVVKIESPITLYLKSQLETESDDRIEISDGSIFASLYDDSSLSDRDIKYECEFDGTYLSIAISKLKSKNDMQKTISLYDYIGNIVATISIIQDGNPEETPPLLGKGGEQCVTGLIAKISNGLSKYNIVEQYYNFNRETNSIKKYVYLDSNIINDTWSEMYNGIANFLILKEEDENRLGVYSDYFNVLSALYYSNLIYGWGDIPYVTKYSKEITPTESYENIFVDLKKNLTKAIENLSEKKNEPLKDINNFFFVSKDVARVLLANIHMYNGNYEEALPLLQKVIDNGFYSLDSSKVFNQVANPELIYGIDGAVGSRSGFMVVGFFPYITLSDVHLSLAECFYKLKDKTNAELHVEKVINIKKLSINENDILMKIKDVREQILLYSGTYFAFLKRTGLAKDVCGIEDYQLLFPIPSSEIILAGRKQNPGY